MTFVITHVPKVVPNDVRERELSRKRQRNRKVQVRFAQPQNESLQPLGGSARFRFQFIQGLKLGTVSHPIRHHVFGHFDFAFGICRPKNVNCSRNFLKLVNHRPGRPAGTPIQLVERDGASSAKNGVNLSVGLSAKELKRIHELIMQVSSSMSKNPGNLKLTKCPNKTAGSVVKKVVASNSQELLELLSALPPIIRERLVKSPDLEKVIEVVLDYGRPAEIRFWDRFERLQNYLVSEDDIRYVSERVSNFGGDNRAGIERTLHRISAIRNRQGRIVGLTCRVGRAIQGTLDIINDIVESNKSILFLGKPGVGKTTKLREVARTLSDEMSKRVVIVDTSNEIAGDGDIPHPAIGSARRMQVSDPASQHQVMIEAVENHMPEVVVIDEIGTEMEAYAARTIAERGVQLVATAHGRALENLMMNPSLCDLVGGIQAVTLSDDEAKRRGTQKTVLERKAPPTFDVVIELIDYDRLAVHHDVQRTVDVILRGQTPQPEIRVRTSAGLVEVVAESHFPEQPALDLGRRPQPKQKDKETEPVSFENGKSNGSPNKTIRIFPYGIARTRLDRAIKEKRANAVISNEMSDADAILAIKSSIQHKPNKLKDRMGKSVPTFVVKSNTLAQISSALEDILRHGNSDSEAEETARLEAMEAVDFVKSKGKAFELTPKTFNLRRVQHQVAEANRLRSEAIGKDPNRRVRVLPV